MARFGTSMQYSLPCNPIQEKLAVGFFAGFLPCLCRPKQIRDWHGTKLGRQRL
jgi:hypothetical protein